MHFPAILFGTLVACLIGAGFHLWKDGALVRLLLDLILSLLGFWVGHLLGVFIGLGFWIFGPLYLGSGILGSVLFLGVGHWLSLVQAQKK
jgi:hypothetical protein